MPSVASQIALASSLIVSGTIIYAVHKFQVDEREQLRKGIKLDIERQAARKAENWRRLQEQKELTKSYKRILKEEENNSEES